MTDETPRLVFHIHVDGQAVRTETLSERIVKIGKLPSSHLRIDHDDVSRMHAVIESSEGGVAIVDLGSASGTFVNQKRVNKQKLASGDSIAFGSVRVELEIEASEERAAVVVAEARPAAAVAEPAIAPKIALPNPFAMPVAAPAAALEPADDVMKDDSTIRWGIAASGPPVNPAEVETTATAAEVVLMWGEEAVLHVAHMSPPRPFFVGEASDGAAVDYALGSELLGTDRVPVVLESGGQIAFVVPEGATGEVVVGADARTLADLAEAGRLTPCAELAGASQMVLPAGATARVRWRGFQFVVKSTSAGKAVGSEVQAPSWASHAWTAMSLGVHATLLLMFYFMPPSSASLSLDLENDPSRLVDYLVEANEVIDEEEPTWLEPASEENGGSSGEAAADDSGEMGDPSETPTDNAYAVEGPADNPDPHLAHDAAVAAASTAGAIGALASLANAWTSPTSPYGRDDASGVDPMSALGALMGDNLGTNFGFGGLGPHGTGRGGGGFGPGTLGVGRFGRLGHGCRGETCGEGPGWGTGIPGDGRRVSHVPSIHVEDAHVIGALSREVIRRTVRRHLNEVRFCYEQELSNRPDLAGRVAVAFMIGGTGAVTSANVGTTTLNNARVESCIVTAVRRWTFPAPEGGGTVGVTYPFVLDSSD